MSTLTLEDVNRAIAQFTEALRPLLEKIESQAIQVYAIIEREAAAYGLTPQEYVARVTEIIRLEREFESVRFELTRERLLLEFRRKAVEERQSSYDNPDADWGVIGFPESDI